MFNISSFIVIISLVSLVLSSGGVVVSLMQEDGSQSPSRVSGVREGNGQEIEVLLINASGESSPIFNDLISGNASYNLTEEEEGETQSGNWVNYDILVWAQGREDRNASMENELRVYVLAGGHLLMEGANVAEHASTTDFEDDVIHASSIDGIPTPLTHYVGQNLTKSSGTHPVTEAPNILSDPMTYISNQTHGRDSDVCTAENGSVVALEWDNVTTVNGSTSDNSNNYGGIFAFDDDSNLTNGGQIVFLSFGILLVENVADRSDLVENVMDWLVPSENEEYYSFYLTPDFQKETTNSGGTVVYDILVMNNGTLDDTIDLVRSAPPSGWQANLNRTSVEVEAGKNTSVSLTVTAPVSAQNGDYANISVTGTSQGDTAIQYTVYTNTTVNNEARSDLEPITLGPDDGYMVLGQDTTIVSLVRNNGDRDAENVIVSFYLDETTNTIGTDTIQVPAGEETDAVILWNATDDFGDHTLLVEVDTGQNNPESNETNNDLSNDTRDWIMRGTLEWADASHNITGNLSISGNFMLDNVTLLFNSTDGAYGLHCLNPGFLSALTSTFGPLGNSADSNIRFHVLGELILTDSVVQRLYYNGDQGDPQGGIEILTSTVSIINTTIQDSGLGIWTSVSPSIERSTFVNITDIGLFSISGSPIINASQFSTMTTAIILRGGSGVVQGCEITEVSTAILASQSSTALLSGNTIHDLNGLKRGILITDSSPTVEMNEIHGTKTAIRIEGESASPMIRENDLSGNDFHSVYCKDSSPIFEENSISNNGENGFYITGGRVIIRDTLISGNTKRGIFAHKTDLTIENVMFQGNDNPDIDVGIFSFDSFIRLFNSTFDSDTFDLDLNLTGSSILQSINSTSENIELTGGSVFSKGWYLHVNAEYRNGFPVPDAEVTVHDVLGEMVYQGFTDAHGIAQNIPIIIYNETDDSTDVFTPHRIDVDLNGGNGNATDIELDETTTIVIVVNTPPIAVIDVNKVEGTSSTVFLFEGKGSFDDSDIISHYLFDFGNGDSTGWIQNEETSYSYEFAGEFTATLRVKDLDGAVSDPDSVDIFVNNPPLVELPDPVTGVYSMTGKQGVELNFEADNVYDPDKWDSLHYFWDFGDETSSTFISPSHAYDDMGDYTVILRVTDDHGGFGEDLMYIEIVMNRPPEADAGGDINVTFNNGANVFFSSHSTDPDGDPLTHRWDFGDGSSSQQKDTNHFYKEPGSYNVTLTVEDDSGANDSVVIEVNVIEYRITFPYEPTIQGKRDKTIRPSIILQNNGSHPVLINLTTLGGWMSLSQENITLDVGETRTLLVTITIPKNPTMGISEQVLVAEAGGKEFYGTIYVDVIKEAGVELSLEDPETQDGDPGDVLSYTVRLDNLGSDVDSFNVQLSSFPPGWIVLLNDLPTVTVDNIGSNNYVYIVVSVTIPEGEIQGLKTVTVIASSISDPATTATIDIKTTVNEAGEDGDDESSIGSLMMISGLLVVFVIIGAIIVSKRNKNYRFAEDEDEEEDSFDNWDDEDEEEVEKKVVEPVKTKHRILKCPKCATLLEVPSAKRPITIQCPGCGARAHIKK